VPKLTRLQKFEAMAGIVSAIIAVLTFFGHTHAQVTGLSIEANGPGPAADVSVNGSANQQGVPIGLDVNAFGAPDQSVTGIRVIQNGSGSGLRVTVGGDGPAIGARVSVRAAPR
jgi:hypothetical protein